MTSPPSPSSCNGNGGVFFNFNSLRNPRTDDFYGSPRAARARSHSLTTPSRYANIFPLLIYEIHNFSFPPRIRLSSQGHELTDDEDDSTDENFSEPNHLIQEHYNYMTLRENMQEFPGRVPQRKRKSKEMENSQQDSSKPKVRGFKKWTRRHENLKSSPKQTEESERERNKKLSHFSPQVRFSVS